MKKLIATLTIAASSVLAGCGLGTAGGYVPTGELRGEMEGVDLDGATLAVGSKNFTEHIILGKMYAIMLRSAGANVQDLTNIPGSSSARQALETGDINVMPEYTGTAWITYLGEDEPVAGEEEQFRAVAEADKEHGLTWLPPAPMNNTYALGATAETTEEYGITSVDDIHNVPEEEQTFCADAEVIARNDGLMTLLDSYGLPTPPRERLKQMDSGAVYAGIANGECTFGTVFATDGRIPALNLTVLEDPEEFFPKYNLSPVVRTEVFEEYPQLEELFAPLNDVLTDERMQELNARVDVDGEDYTQVARDFLIEEGWLEI
ncbi:Periplasmic glycine betaine/choline-binding (Lipo)protein of an ABC-type transport system [Corynebacterium camporealensis]|uniref:Periplasmic glycine betaine/choline-binding (Lipo)protein of an ABC-type transport system n=1 Tax=Corynebacterium camporealensis TaxID=161896 RepID=A0A0F6T9W0_9CORY|nr:glycine betaine ABC transporter substrate-binding protein [Corynebacterium camporealensis]AKE38516.1 periplasmic glycine betaine/choline-binding (lipo)protein of an ABC-type transport system [Corynebacterium camporealensis]AVH87815.1 Periplasmic glycine betaine/choline-binding (Lipo)protein of an ABC-type transport system [Corynebacterium camporealensis]